MRGAFKRKTDPGVRSMIRVPKQAPKGLIAGQRVWLQFVQLSWTNRWQLGPNLKWAIWRKNGTFCKFGGLRKRWWWWWSSTKWWKTEWKSSGSANLSPDLTEPSDNEEYGKNINVLLPPYSEAVCERFKLGWHNMWRAPYVLFEWLFWVLE